MAVTDTALIVTPGAEAPDGDATGVAVALAALDVEWHTPAPPGSAPRALVACAAADGAVFVQAFDVIAPPQPRRATHLRPAGARADVLTTVSLRSTDALTTVAGAGASGGVYLWQLGHAGPRGPWRLQARARRVLDVRATPGTVCVLDAWGALSVFDVAETGAWARAGAPDLPPPAYVVNPPADLEPYAAAAGLGPAPRLSVHGDLLCLGPQALTEHLQMLRFSAPRAPRAPRGPVRQLSATTLLFVGWQTALQLTLMAAYAHATTGSCVAARVAAALALGALLLVIVATGAYCHTPLHVFWHGALFWSDLGARGGAAVLLVLGPWRAEAAGGALLAVYLGAFLWRAGLLRHWRRRPGARRGAAWVWWAARQFPALCMLELLFGGAGAAVGVVAASRGDPPAAAPPPADSSLWLGVGFVVAAAAVCLADVLLLLRLFCSASDARRPVPADQFLRAGLHLLLSGAVLVLALAFVLPPWYPFSSAAALLAFLIIVECLRVRWVLRRCWVPYVMI